MLQLIKIHLGFWVMRPAFRRKKPSYMKWDGFFCGTFLLIFYHSENVSSGNHLPILVLVIVIFVYH